MLVHIGTMLLWHRLTGHGGDAWIAGMTRTLLVLLLLTAPAWAQPRHALSVLGTPALPADFPHFPYVNPTAPKGGEVVFAMTGSFDGFNPYILRGNSAIGVTSQWSPGVGGSAAGSAGGHVYESLLVGSANEVATGYGHLAETVELAPDGLSLAFTIRPQARFADGSPVTAADVVWTYETLIEKGVPSLRVVLSDVAGAEADGERRVVFRFKTAANRDLSLAIGGLPVLSKAWWATRDFSRPLTEPPMSSGPYRVDTFELARSVTYARRDDWWARDLPTGRGLHNFDRVRIDYYRDQTVAFQAFKAGRADYRQENKASDWATAYDFPAARDGLVIKREIQHKVALGNGAFIFNTRRPLFQDARVREAFATLFDFEWLNKTIFVGQYARTTSYFGNTLAQSTDVPEGTELALLEPFRAKLPPSVFTTPFKLPVTDGSGNNREGLRRALALFREAGWTVRDRKLVDPAGIPIVVGFLLNDPSYERVVLPYKQWLERAGIELTIRTVDPAQYQRLIEGYDFDMTWAVYPASELPGLELRETVSCAGGKVAGGENLAGVCDPVVDALVDIVVAAQDRTGLSVAGRALDRVLLAGWFGVPLYNKSRFDIAVWDRFGMPGVPVRSGFVIDSWWVDPAKAARVEAGRGR